MQPSLSPAVETGTTLQRSLKWVTGSRGERRGGPREGRVSLPAEAAGTRERGAEAGADAAWISEVIMDWTC